MHIRILEIATGPYDQLVKTLEEKITQSEEKAARLGEVTSRILELRKILEPVLRDGGPSSAEIQIEANAIMSSMTIRNLVEIRTPSYRNPAFNVALEQAVQQTAYLHALVSCHLGF